MGDSWEDEDFEVPTFNTAALKDDWDDEVDETQLENTKLPAPPSAAQIEAARKRSEDAEKALALKMKMAVLANETPEERRLREKRQVEEADNELSAELFDTQSQKSAATTNSVKGIGSVVLKTKQDHSNLGTATASRLSESTTFNVGAFFKNAVKALDRAEVTAETLDEIIADLNKMRDTKAKAAKAVAGPKKTKKEIKGAVKKHNDVFGGSDYVDKYEDSYGGMEDDFM